MSDTPTPPASPTPPSANWRDTLPDDLKSDPSLATFQDTSALAKSYTELRKVLGVPKERILQLPDKPDDEAGWGNVFNRLGRPESPDKYSKVEEAALKKAGISPEALSTAMPIFHKAGLTDKQAKVILDWYVGDLTKASELDEQRKVSETQSGTEKLKEAWGDKFDAKMGLVRAWINKFAPNTDFAARADSLGLASSPEFVQALVKSAEATLEESTRTGNTSNLGPDSLRASAAMEIEAVMRKRIADKAYNALFDDPKSPERIRWDELHKLKNANV